MQTHTTHTQVYMIKNNNKQKTNTKTSNYVIQNKLELWSSFLLAFFKLTKKQQIK